MHFWKLFTSSVKEVKCPCLQVLGSQMTRILAFLNLPWKHLVMAAVELLGDVLPRWFGLTKLSLFPQSLDFTSSPSVYLLQGYAQVLILFWKHGGSQGAPEATPLLNSGNVSTAQVPSYNQLFVFPLLKTCWSSINSVVVPRYLTVRPVSGCLKELKREDLGVVADGMTLALTAPAARQVWILSLPQGKCHNQCLKSMLQWESASRPWFMNSSSLNSQWNCFIPDRKGSNWVNSIPRSLQILGKKGWASQGLGCPCPVLVQLDLALGKLSLEACEVVV